MEVDHLSFNAKYNQVVETVPEVDNALILIKDFTVPDLPRYTALNSGINNPSILSHPND